MLLQMCISGSGLPEISPVFPSLRLLRVFSTFEAVMNSSIMDKLPPEIRLLIYRELLRDEVHYLERQRKNPSNEPCESKIYPAVLGVCKQIYSEASAVLYEENIFGYDDRNEDTVVDGKTLYHGDNPPKGPFNRIKHVSIAFTFED